MSLKKRSVSFDTLVKMFLRDYNIPTRKDIEKLTARMDQLEHLLRQVIAEEGHSSVADKKTGSRSPGRDTEFVLQIIGRSEKGQSFSEILAQTDFDEKKLRNIIYRLDKKGFIRKVSRGVYALQA